VIALVGVTVYRALFDVRGPVTLGPTDVRLSDACVFVLPNPSGRNAHYSYADMLAVYRELAGHVGIVDSGEWTVGSGQWVAGGGESDSS
jgi:TDG/mug DNA glycosylase family protein